MTILMPIFCGARCNKEAVRNEDMDRMDTREDRWAVAMRAERLGDSAAYEAFLKEFAGSLRRIVAIQLQRLRLGMAELEDVVQEVLIAVHARRHQWDPQRPLRPWLNAITRYKIIDASRRLRRENSGRIDFTDQEWSALFAGEGDRFERNAADIEMLISELPRREQEAVRALGLEGASAREAADRLGSSEGAVRVAFHRSLRRLMTAAKKRL
jgi:RNA polymerase sigma-70 factor (ECF subfamily)